MKGKVKTDQNSITMKVMIYLLCKNFGWTLEYVCNLTIRQIKFLFSGEVEYNNLINKSSGKSKNKGINSTDDLIGSKIFKVNKKRK
jgi:hypothetical protein